MYLIKIFILGTGTISGFDANLNDQTGDLFRLRRNVILKMTKELYKEGDAKGF